MKLNCRLCGAEKIFTLRTFDLAALRREWRENFGFDAFANFGPTESELRQHRCSVCALEFYSPDYVGDGQFYERLAHGDWYYEPAKWEFDEAIRRLGGNPGIRSLLEIGCGKGFFLEKVTGCFDALGLEINPAAVEHCRRRHLNVSTDRVETLEREFDAIVAFEVLEHLAQPRELLAHITRRLAPGGSLIFAVPNPESYLREFDHVLLDMPPHHATRWNRQTFEYLSREFRLQLVGIAHEPLRYVHYKSYLAALAHKHHPAPRGSLGKTLRRHLGKLLAPLLDRVLLPLAYQHHKQLLAGQTHLAEFRKA
jgi:SAM-dependent methyltransferase